MNKCYNIEESVENYTDENRLILYRNCEKLKTAIQEHKNSVWEEKFQKISVADQRKMHRPLTKRTLLHWPNGMVYTDKGKAEIFANILELTYSTSNDEDIAHTNNVERTEHRYWRIERNM